MFRKLAKYFMTKRAVFLLGFDIYTKLKKIQIRHAIFTISSMGGFSNFSVPKLQKLSIVNFATFSIPDILYCYRITKALLRCLSIATCVWYFKVFLKRFCLEKDARRHCGISRAYAVRISTLFCEFYVCVSV